MEEQIQTREKLSSHFRKNAFETAFVMPISVRTYIKKTEIIYIEMHRMYLFLCVFLLGSHNCCNCANEINLKIKTLPYLKNSIHLKLRLLQPFLRYHFFIISFSTVVTINHRCLVSRNNKWQLIYHALASLYKNLLPLHRCSMCWTQQVWFLHKRKSVLHLGHVAMTFSWHRQVLFSALIDFFNTEFEL